jgi:hypothetical protein
MTQNEENEHDAPEREGESEFGELLKFTFGGFTLGLAAGWLLDRIAGEVSGLGQWLVRTLSGESESVAEGFYAIRARLRNSAGSLAEAYGWGKFIGIAVPWVVDAASRALGVDMFGVESIFVPYLYAQSDQIMANVAGFVYLRRNATSSTAALRSYLRNPVMASSWAVILVVPVGLWFARAGGFAPDTHVRTAIETIGANLCWIPPLVGAAAERLRRT